MAVEWKTEKSERRWAEVGRHTIVGERPDEFLVQVNDIQLIGREDIEALRDLCDWVLGGEVESLRPEDAEAPEPPQADWCDYGVFLRVNGKVIADYYGEGKSLTVFVPGGGLARYAGVDQRRVYDLVREHGHRFRDPK